MCLNETDSVVLRNVTVGLTHLAQQRDIRLLMGDLGTLDGIPTVSKN